MAGATVVSKADTLRWVESDGEGNLFCRVQEDGSADICKGFWPPEKTLLRFTDPEPNSKASRSDAALKRVGEFAVVGQGPWQHLLLGRDCKITVGFEDLVPGEQVLRYPYP